MKVRILDPVASLPTRASDEAAGFDITTIEDFVLAPGERRLTHTGLALQLPKGTYGMLAPRSGLAVRHGVTIGAGVVDSDFRGEVRVLLFNHGSESIQFTAGDRVAQIVVERIAQRSSTSPSVVLEDLGVRGALQPTLESAP